MGVSWRGGRNTRNMQQDLRERRALLRQRALRALEDSVEEGAAYTRDNLEDAHTRTGLRRAESGGLPGRHDTGEMVGAVGAEVREPSANPVWGVFGWWGSNYQRYFRDQDLGEGNIPAARALPAAFLRAQENFRARLQDISRGKDPR